MQWICDWPEAKSQTFSLYQGETATFEPTFRVNGRTVTNATIEAVWYTTNFVGTTGSPSVASREGWWKLDGATFAPSNDVGAASYRFFVEAKASGDTIYRANGALRMLPSPGFTPNAIEPPVQTLDFNTIEVANAPYYDKAETEAKIVELAPAPGDYAAVSNAAVHAAITNALQDTAIAEKQDKLPYPTNAIPYAAISGKPSLATVATAATNYTDSATNSLSASLSSQLSRVSQSATNYTDSATNSLASTLRGEIAAAQPADYATVSNKAMTAVQPGALAVTNNFVKKSGDTVTGLLKSSAPLGEAWEGFGINGTIGYYGGTHWGVRIGTGANSDDAVIIGKQGNEIVVPSSSGTMALASEIPSTASEVGAVPTSRTINGKALSSNITLSASDVGAASTNDLATLSDYNNLSDKPQINGVSLSGNKTGADLGVLDLSGGTMTGDLNGPNISVRDTAGGYITMAAEVIGTFFWYRNGWRGGNSPVYQVYLPEGNGTLALSSDIFAAATAATNYTDAATNSLSTSLSSQLSQASQAATNYTDAATNSLSTSLSSQLSQASQAATNYTDSAIADADTTYRMTVGITNLNQTVQYVNAPASATELAIELPTGSGTKDWIVYVNAATNMTLVLPPATWWMADTAYTNALEAASKTALYFSQVTDGTYILGRQAMEAVEVTP